MLLNPKRHFLRKYKKAGVHTTLWGFLNRFESESARIDDLLAAGDFELGPCKTMKASDGEPVLYFEDYRDRYAVAKVAEILEGALGQERQSNYFMAKGQGKEKAIRAVIGRISEYQYVYKTDVHSYYRSIDQDILYKNLGLKIRDPGLLRLVGRILTPVVQNGHRYSYHR